MLVNRQLISIFFLLLKAVATSNFSRSFDSISNSLSSNSVSNNNIVEGQLLPGLTPQNNDTNNKYNNNIRLQNHSDDSKISVQKSKTLYDPNQCAQVTDTSWAISSSYPDRSVGKYFFCSMIKASNSFIKLTFLINHLHCLCLDGWFRLAIL